MITGIGSCLPAHSLDNDEVIRTGALDTTDEWIRTRTGITRRRRVTPGTATGDLATAAGRAAMTSAGLRPDLVLLATTTPDRPCPATAPAVAHRLGLGEVPAFDLAAVCSGFLYGLVTATALLRAGVCRTPLVIGADTYSAIIDPHDRDTAALFGDGAAAVVLTPGPADAPGSVLHAALGSDGSGEELITVPGGGSRHPARLPQPLREPHSFRMRGREVYAHAVRRMTGSARTVLDLAGWPAGTVEAFVAHQANQRILDSVADRLGIGDRNRFGNIDRLGNTAAASIPLVMADPEVHAAVRPGARTLLTAFGGGLTWGSIALTWPTAVPHRLPVEQPPATDT
ncbi:beta-ketoacyl-ACP synthase 3 [Streptomyces sp. NPDC097619]|uniref:beta-ketoacyl-ACP synthase 3 n=1 Tax=Streptomyces sp. NPDC097619 TaxID=3157228 RepID=UPI003327D44F